MLLCIIGAILGAVMTIFNDLQDQSEGRMRMWGDWWQGFGNNVVSNHPASAFCFVAIALVACMWQRTDTPIRVESDAQGDHIVAVKPTSNKSVHVIPSAAAAAAHHHVQPHHSHHHAMPAHAHHELPAHAHHAHS